MPDQTEGLELLKVACERSDAVMTYWTIYVTLVIGALGILASAKPFTKSTIFKGILIVAFVVFAGSNLEAIYQINVQRFEIIKLAASPYVAAIQATRPPPHWQLIAYHVAIDLAVIALVWFVPWQQSAGRTVSAK